MQAVKPVRVCFLIDELATAGTESQLVALIQQLDRTRVEPFLVLLRGDSELSRSLEPEGCLRLGVGSLRHPRTAAQAWKFVQFLWRERIDVVQTYFPDSSYFGIPTAWVARVPHRLRTRNNVGHWLTTWHRRLGRALNLLTTGTIANCHAARDALLRDERPDPARVVVLENGVDLERFLDLPLPKEATHRIGVVANLRHVKGLDVLLSAFPQLMRIYPDVTLHVAGEGDERERLTQQIHALKLADRVFLHGIVKNVPAFLASLDVAVLPSRAEGMSNALLEYLAAGRPTVATAVGAASEILRDGRDGLLVAPDDPDALARAVDLLLRDRAYAGLLGDNARRRARERYSRAAMVRRFEDFYVQLLAPAPRGSHATAAVGAH